MPTESNQWLDRDASSSGADKLIELACPVLREIVNKATITFEECQKEVKGEPDEDLPMMMSFLHLMEMGDAVERLLASSSVAPATLQLRSMFEAVLGMQYISEADSKRRAFAWLVARAHRSLKLLRSVSATTPAGVELRGLISGDAVKIDLDAVPADQVDSAIENDEQMLKQENYDEVDKEYRRVRNRGKKKTTPEWYSLFGGPPNLRELAKHLGQTGGYQFLYRQWSEITHAGDGGRWLTQMASGEPAFHALRTRLNSCKSPTSPRTF